MTVISGYQAERIVKAMVGGKKTVMVSLDLGITKTEFSLLEDIAVFPDRQKLKLDVLKKMSKDESDCFYLEDNQAYRIQCYSEKSKKFLKLYSTGVDTAPTVAVSGIRMHQTKNRNPIEDSLLKVSSIKISGLVLDTCTGLGYTAIYSRKKGAEKVVTVESEPLMIEVARKNPWSRQLFEDNGIELKEGDVSTLVKEFRENSFNAVIHDPPRLSLAGNLYSLDFYKDLNRALKPGGGLFHYVGDPGGRYRNRRITLGVKKRLQDAGFRVVEDCEKAQGVRAFK